MAAKSNYNESNIQILEGLEAVRKRPALTSILRKEYIKMLKGSIAVEKFPLFCGPTAGCSD